MMKKILFVCMGNICRSPLAAGVARRQLDKAGLGKSVTIDSAGTYGAHAGEKADPRARQVAKAAGYDIEAHRARAIRREDFDRFDLILAMDQDNLNALRRIHPGFDSKKVRLLLDLVDPGCSREVPDPYYGNLAGFEQVRNLCEEGAQALIEYLRTDTP